MLIYVDSQANNNKFYEVKLSSDGITVTKRWGRVGADGQMSIEKTGRLGFDNAVYAKERKGYKKVAIAAPPTATTSVAANTQITTIAKTALTKGKARTDTRVADLIERICRVNAHDIATLSGGKITVDTSGQVKTPLGLITNYSISEARGLLTQIEQAGGVKDTSSTRLLEDYLTLVPQNIGRNAGWASTFFNRDNTFQKQHELLDSLRDSVQFFNTQLAAATTAAIDDVDGNEYDNLFKYKVRAVADGGAVFKRIEERYAKTKNGMHTSAKLNLKHVFELVDPVGAATYKRIAAEIRNEQQMWHGTRAANLLSILQKGLFVPPRSGSGIQIAGRMFGDGLYLSLDSTKSLNYSNGYWTSGGRDNNCFMLLNDVAMGSEYRPSHYSDWPKAHSTVNKFGKPWNSINVKPGTAGVRNHEAIVFDTNQVRVRYLCEFDA